MSTIGERFQEMPSYLKLLLVVGIGIAGIVITLLLSAILGSFFLSMGSPPADLAPHAEFQYAYDGEVNELNATHHGGDTIAAENLRVTVNSNELQTVNISGDFQAGDSFTVRNVERQDIVKIVYVGDEEHHVIGEYTIPP